MKKFFTEDRIAKLAGFVPMVVLAIYVTFRMASPGDSTAHAAVPSIGYKEEVGISGQVITNPTTATFLAVPLGAQHAWITIKNNPACFSYDASLTGPTADSGGEFAPGTFHVPNDRKKLQALRFINCAEGATTIKVYYSRDRRIGD